MFGRQYDPLTQVELSILLELLSGTEPEMDLLRSQVAVNVWLARRYDAPWLGVMPRRKSIIMHKPGGVVFAPALSEQQLGDRRKVIIDDLVVRDADDRLVRCELTILNGFIHGLRAIGQAAGEAMPLQATSIDLRTIAPNDYYYVSGPSDTSGTRLRARAFRIREGWGDRSANRSERWASCLAELESLEQPIQEDELYPGLRELVTSRRVLMAKPASRDEVAALERRLNLTLSQELSELWQCTNGMSVFGEPLCGTYDTSLFESIVLGGGRHVVLMTSVYQSATDVVAQVASAGEGAPDVLPVTMYSWEDNECLETWNSVEEFLRQYTRAVDLESHI